MSMNYVHNFMDVLHLQLNIWSMLSENRIVCNIFYVNITYVIIYIE